MNIVIVKQSIYIYLSLVKLWNKLFFVCNNLMRFRGTSIQFELGATTEQPCSNQLQRKILQCNNTCRCKEKLIESVSNGWKIQFLAFNICSNLVFQISAPIGVEHNSSRGRSYRLAVQPWLVAKCNTHTADVANRVALVNKTATQVLLFTYWNQHFLEF